MKAILLQGGTRQVIEISDVDMEKDKDIRESEYIKVGTLMYIVKKGRP
jgi:hypothetical protein